MSRTVAAPSYAGALLSYRIMAFATGVVLLAGSLALVLKYVIHVHHMEPVTGLIWLGHGYLYLVYVITTVNLALKTRWPWLRMLLVILAGTVPTMSFVAERYVTRDTRERIELASASRGA